VLFFPALLAWLTRNRPVEEPLPAVNVACDVAAAPIEPLDNQPTTATTLPPEPVIAASAPIVASAPPIVPEPVEIAAPLQPAPVTEEEIAALLESAFSTWHSADPADVAESEASQDTPESAPRRCNLPRRSEAA
jgi:hypothetical protein